MGEGDSPVKHKVVEADKLGFLASNNGCGGETSDKTTISTGVTDTGEFVEIGIATREVLTALTSSQMGEYSQTSVKNTSQRKR